MRKAAKFKKIVILVIIVMLVLGIAVIAFGIHQYRQNRLYEELQMCFEQGKYTEAERIIYELGEYKDAKELLSQCKDMVEAATLMEQNEYVEAREIYRKYNMEDEVNESTYQLAISYTNSKEYEKALQEFAAISSYKDVKGFLSKCQDMIKAGTLIEEKKYKKAEKIYQKYKMQDEVNECIYQLAITYAKSKEYEKALQEFITIQSYKDVVDQAKAIDYDYALTLYNKQQYTKAKLFFEDAGNYKDAVDFVEKCNIGIKYEKCELDTTQFNANDPVAMYSYVEDQLVECFYSTWYDVNGKELVIDKDSINGIPYQVISIETNGAYPVFCFNFVNDATQHTICRLSPVTDADVINFMENISFDSSTYYEYSGKKQKKILAAALEWEEQLEQEEEAKRQQEILQKESIKIACCNDVLNYYNIEGRNPAEQIFIAFNAWQVYNEKITISGSNCIFECDVSQIWNFGLHGHRVEAQYLIDENGNIQRKSIISK